MVSEIITDWRRPTTDEFSSTNSLEIFIRELGNGIKLFYSRAHSFYGDEISYYAVKDPANPGRDMSFELPEKDTRPKLFAMLYEGRLVVSAIGINHKLVFKRTPELDKERLDYLVEMAEELEQFLPFFEGVPTQNPHYPKELDTLKLVRDSGARFIVGEFQEEDFRLFHGYNGPGDISITLK